MLGLGLWYSYGKIGVADAIVLMLVDVAEADSSSGLIKDILNCKETKQRVKKYTK